MAAPSGRGRAPPPRRFYERAEVAPAAGGFALLLNGRRAMTPARKPLLLPTGPLAEAVAAEWNGQGATIDPRAMPLTRLANTAIDGVAAETEAVKSDLLRYAGSDLVAYRAADPETLVAEQAARWDPVLAWAREALGARFILSEGVTFVAQPETALARVAEVVARETSPLRIAALHVLTTLTGSALIALMHAAGRLTADEAWQAAHVDELYQESRWGEDDEAARRREGRRDEFDAACRTLTLTAPA